ncbi:hypothetical protein [Pseudoduganella umbonata]|uniref:Uncharacterized protein n=1 Tax=Pseudoduganella umbonata TaxID=864828 RepID=A0A4P8HVR9_9BURK|nr:hypothetical protein [Pseudoduganella umbonata]MBB3225402.1 hypothetical protein [Pseudoduganella umbonata]QCP14167.1 hypothetical protein FCL38_29950 [Pseudoduganella umbonata]
MKELKLFSTILFIVVAAFSSGCTDSNNNELAIMPNTVITLTLHETGDSFHKRHPDLVRVTRQPLGLSFYKAQWSSRSRGTVKIAAGNRLLQVEDVLSLIGTQDDDIRTEGISTVHLTSGITGPHGITHEAARDYFFAVLSRLRNEGWKSSIPFDDPRLRGKDMLNYQMAVGSSTPLDADYKPTLQEWIKLEDRSAWELYSDSAFLRISFKRAPNPDNPSGPGVYLVHYDLDSSVNHFKGFVDPLRREEWKALLPAELKDLAARRSKAEAALREKGIPIDTDYVDPPIPW